MSIATVDWATVSAITDTAAKDFGGDEPSTDDVSRFVSGYVSPSGNRCKLFGRKRVQRQIEDIWRRISHESSTTSEILWLYGPSGVGKSYLLNAMRNFVHRTNNGIFVVGKFDQLSVARREPFYAVVAAMSDICEIVSADPGYESIANGLCKKLEADLRLLHQFIPTMKQLMSRNCGDGQVLDEDLGGMESMARLSRACKAFFSCIAGHHPIFFVLEDLHWADPDTVHLLQNLFSDMESKRVCFVLTAREGELSPESISRLGGFERKLASFKSVEGSPTTLATLPTTSIKISNLSEAEVCQMLCGLLACSDDDPNTTTLTTLVYAKTSGNPLFVVQYLEMIRSEGVLAFSDGNRWVWNDLEKMARLDVSEDVLKSIDARIYSLDRSTRRALMIAAHLGFRFRCDVLETVLQPIEERINPDEDEVSPRSRFLKIVESAEKASMLFFTNGRNELCFMHDSIQQRFIEMFTDSGVTKEQLYLGMARRLRSTAESGDESLKFFITDSFNKGRALITEEEEKMFILNLNRDTSELAKKKSSYSAASHYLQVAISLLDASTWSKRYELTLSLYSSYALCAANAGEFEECDNAVEVIRTNANTVLDRQFAYKARLHSLELQNRHKDVALAGEDALKELGYRMRWFNSTKLSIFYRTMRIRSRLKKLSDAVWLAMPTVEDKHKQAMCDIMEMTFSSTFILSPDKFVQSFQRILTSSFKDGISGGTPYALACFGLIEIAMFHDFDSAARCGRLSKSIVDKYNLSEAECGAILTSDFYIFPWVRPWVDSIEPLTQGFHAGLKHGKLFFASSCLGMTCPMLLLLGPLSSSEKKIRNIVMTQMQLLEKGVEKKWTEVYWQQVMNLMGMSEHKVMLNGDAMHEVEFLATYSSTAIAMGNYYGRKLELACYYGCHPLALKHIKLLEQDEAAISLVCPFVVSKHCFGAVTYLVEAKRSGKLYYARKARKALKKLRKIFQSGCRDAGPFLKVVEAELEAFEGKGDAESLKLKFDSAIEAAVSCRFMGIAAFACERAYAALKEHHQEDSRNLYWNNAMEFYSKWEAFGKVDQMQQLKDAEMETSRVGFQPPSVIKVDW